MLLSFRSCTAVIAVLPSVPCVRPSPTVHAARSSHLATLPQIVGQGFKYTRTKWPRKGTPLLFWSIKCTGNAMQYNTIQKKTQYNIIQYNTIQYNTIQKTQYNTIQYNKYNTMQCNATQRNTIQYNTIQYNTSYFRGLKYAFFSVIYTIIYRTSTYFWRYIKK